MLILFVVSYKMSLLFYDHGKWAVTIRHFYIVTLVMGLCPCGSAAANGPFVQSPDIT
jgi:hypothetical protein